MFVCCTLSIFKGLLYKKGNEVMVYLSTGKKNAPL